MQPKSSMELATNSQVGMICYKIKDYPELIPKVTREKNGVKYDAGQQVLMENCRKLERWDASNVISALMNGDVGTAKTILEVNGVI